MMLLLLSAVEGIAFAVTGGLPDAVITSGVAGADILLLE
jgi:hypothetical protein